jgi:hypothetical protein
MKLRRIAGGAAILAAVGIGFVGCQSGPSKGVVQFSSHDSPIDVGGGSIYGSVRLWNLNTWAEIQTSRLYGSRSNNNDYVQLTGFSSSAIFQNTGGWLITVYTKMSDGTTKNPNPSIAFCSSANAAAPYCNGNSLSDKIVYVEITSKTAKWDWSRDWWKHRVEFEDTLSGCTGTESLCDQIDSITVTTVNPMPSLQVAAGTPSSGSYTYGPYTCSVNSKCKITAGK